MQMYVKQPVTAKPNYCVPAVLQMVLEHHGIYGFTQESIASQLVIYPDHDNIPHENWGTQISSHTLNDFFSQNGIALREEYIHIGHFMDDYFFQEALPGLLRKTVSIICGFNYTWLYSQGEDTFRHVSIITDFEPATETVTLLDPGPREPGYKSVSAYKLYQAIKAGDDGLWCVYEADNSSLQIT